MGVIASKYPFYQGFCKTNKFHPFIGYNSEEEVESSYEYQKWDVAVNIKQYREKTFRALTVGEKIGRRTLRSRHNIRGFLSNQVKEVIVRQLDPLILEIPIQYKNFKKIFYFSKENPWYPDVFVNVLYHFLSCKLYYRDPSPITLTEESALEIVKDAWNKDFVKRQENPDNPEVYAFTPEEIKNIMDGIVLLILIRHSFICENWILDLHKYIPVKEIETMWMDKRAVFRGLRTRRKFLIFPETKPDPIDKVKVLEDIKSKEKLKELVDQEIKSLRVVASEINIVTNRPSKYDD